MPEDVVPEPGDVIVRELERPGQLVYVLSRAPGPDQYFVRTREEAIGQALRFAVLSRVRAWFAQSGAGHMPLPFAVNRGAPLPLPAGSDAPGEPA